MESLKSHEVYPKDSPITNEILVAIGFSRESMSCSQRKPNQKKQGDE
jgi:hypothetical protein